MGNSTHVCSLTFGDGGGHIRHLVSGSGEEPGGSHIEEAPRARWKVEGQVGNMLCEGTREDEKLFLETVLATKFQKQTSF